MKLWGRKQVEAIATEVHLTVEDGTKSLLQLIQEQDRTIKIPNEKVLSFYFVIDSKNDHLIVVGTESQPPGFQLGIKPGATLTFPIVKLPVNAEVLMSGFLMRTDSVCNFFVRVEFYP